MPISNVSRSAAICAITLATLVLGACTTVAPDKPGNTESAQATVSQPSWPEWTRTECVPMAKLDQQPQLRRQTSPIIQSSWFPKGLSTTVTFLLEVTPQGTLGRVLWQPANTDPRIVKSIQKSLARWKFTPGIRQGQPVTTCFEQPYELIFPPINEPMANTP